MKHKYTEVSMYIYTHTHIYEIHTWTPTEKNDRSGYLRSGKVMPDFDFFGAFLYFLIVL